MDEKQLYGMHLSNEEAVQDELLEDGTLVKRCEIVHFDLDAEKKIRVHIRNQNERLEAMTKQDAVEVLEHLIDEQSSVLMFSGRGGGKTQRTLIALDRIIALQKAIDSLEKEIEDDSGRSVDDRA